MKNAKEQSRAKATHATPTTTRPWRTRHALSQIHLGGFSLAPVSDSNCKFLSDVPEGNQPRPTVIATKIT